MKIKFNRNVKHDNVLYLQGETYEFEGEMTPELQAMLDITHTDVFTQKSEAEEGYEQQVNVAEVAPDNVEAKPQPAPEVKTARVGAQPAMPPAPNV